MTEAVVFEAVMSEAVMSEAVMSEAVVSEAVMSEAVMSEAVMSEAVMSEVVMSEVVVYADGACKGNPGPGGWGVWLRSGAHERELFGGDKLTTNNRMELTAVIEALALLKRRSTVVIYTDSQYVKNGITTWIHGWKARGWTTAGKQPVKNKELWQRLDALNAAHKVSWRWVKGHSGDPGNERADALANQGVASVM